VNEDGEDQESAGRTMSENRLDFRLGHIAGFKTQSASVRKWNWAIAAGDS